DLSQLVDADDDNWQLVDVQSYNASVTPKEPDNITNKVLEFTAAMPGEHIISYVIADHYNNFSYGLVKVSVTAKESEIDWGDLNVLNKKFISPVTYSDGIESGFHVFPLWDSVKSNTISGYNIFSGDAYCRTLGNLPTEEQMNALHVKHYELNGSGELNKWPMEKKYLIKDNASYFSYDISSGLKGEKVTASSGAYYVTCIQDENISLSTVGNIEINPDDKNERVLFGTITKHPDMNVAIYQIPELDGGGNLLGSDVDLLVSGSGSELSITTLNNELGTYAIKVMDTSNPENYITSQLVNYIPRTLASATIDIVKTRNGKLFTNSPSVAYLKKINGQSIADAIQKEGEKGKDAQGPAGDFYKFNFEHAENLCDHYNTLSIGDRDDWRLPTKKELKDQLFKEFDNMFEARGWPTAIRYWTKTSTDPNTYNTVRLSNGAVGSNPNEENNNYYVSCVSGPEKPDLAGEEIDFVYDKYGNLFTSSPSDAYLRSIGGPNYDRYNIGDGIKGPEGKFGLFNWENAKKVCDTYKKKKIHSRDNWRLPSQEELQRLYFKDGAGPNAFDFFNKHGWPVSNYYWTRTLVDTIYPDKYYFSFSLFNGNYYSRVLKETLFVSCVSVPDS
ncbi:Lcl domain-containing protein, partial [Photobacterium angustum]